MAYFGAPEYYKNHVKEVYLSAKQNSYQNRRHATFGHQRRSQTKFLSSEMKSRHDCVSFRKIAGSDETSEPRLLRVNPSSNLSKEA